MQGKETRQRAFWFTGYLVLCFVSGAIGAGLGLLLSGGEGPLCAIIGAIVGILFFVALFRPRS